MKKNVVSHERQRFIKDFCVVQFILHHVLALQEDRVTGQLYVMTAEAE